MPVPAQVNSWINPSSGNWDQAANWSLGVLPGSSQAVMLTNSGWKAVAIGPSTAVQFPGSMTVNSLTIRGAWDTRNVLLMNYVGTTVPLTVLNGLTLQDMAQLVNFSSGVVVEGGTVVVTNAQINQDGGFMRTTGATMQLQGAEYNLTNGAFEGGTVQIGAQSPSGPSRFNQYGGSVVITNLGFMRAPGYNGGGYALHGGYLSLPGGLWVTGENGAAVSYVQNGGSNGTTQVLVKPGLYGSAPEFKLNGGLLTDDDVAVYGDDFGPATLEQNGGAHVVANKLTVAGGSTHGQTIRPGTYQLNDGGLSAPVIELNGNSGDAVFVQSNGITSAQSFWAHSVGWYGSFNTTILLQGGSLSCSNLTIQDGRGLLQQSGGELVVSDLLDVGGVRDTGLWIYYGTYSLQGGTLTASNINITGIWVIGDSAGANRITNSGYCRLSRRLRIGNAVEQLGRFILGTNAVIDLGGSSSRLSFANSSGESWAAGAMLVVSNWNGSLSGGGAEQLKFGTDSSGLTSAQLKQIAFQIGSELRPARILDTGEVVPDEAGLGVLAYSRQGNQLVLTWPSGYALQTATNVAGPYVTVPEATSPYTNDMTLDPQRFFRLAP